MDVFRLLIKDGPLPTWHGDVEDQARMFLKPSTTAHLARKEVTS